MKWDRYHIIRRKMNKDEYIVKWNKDKEWSELSYNVLQLDENFKNSAWIKITKEEYESNI